MPGDDGQRASGKWVALAYKLTRLPSRNRVFVWRKLREAGAIYFQQSVALLPSGETQIGFFQEMKRLISSYGGEAALISMDFMSPEDEEKAVEQFNANVSSDYGEVEKVFVNIMKELDGIHQSHVMSLALLEDRLQQIRRTKILYEKIKLRDYFRSRMSDRMEQTIETVVNRIDSYIWEIKSGKAGLTE